MKFQSKNILIFYFIGYLQKLPTAAHKSKNWICKPEMRTLMMWVKKRTQEPSRSIIYKSCFSTSLQDSHSH